MQDNEIVYRIELNNEEYKILENLQKELYNKLSKMDKDEIKKYFETLCIESNLSFEKEINGTTYKVNTYFSKDSEYTILQELFRIWSIEKVISI